MPGQGTSDGSLYDTLGLTPQAEAADVRRQFRKLATQLHPDRAGNSPEAVEHFQRLQLAYAVLSDPVKRKAYDQTGTWARGADEQFLAAFSGGAFQDRGQSSPAMEPSPLYQLAVKPEPFDAKPSHSAGFEAWLRARGEDQGVVFDAETAAEHFGVVSSSYEAVAIAPQPDCLGVFCAGAGEPSTMLSLRTQRLPASLEWGQVLVQWRFAPINPADLYSARLGGIYGPEAATPPYVAGHDGVGVVSKVGPGVKALFPGDVVLPAHSFLGTWQHAAVVREGDVLRVPASITSLLGAAPGSDELTDAPFNDTVNQYPVGLEVLAVAREACVAYLLLERFGGLKPGDCLILNAATSSVGQAVIQMARLLRLRVVAVVRPPKASKVEAGGQTPAYQPSNAVGLEQQRVEAWLKGLGATVVVQDTGSLRVALESMKFFSRPKLALDSVGGDSAVRLAEALADGGELVTYGCMSGRAAAWPWQAWVFRELRVTGFNLRRWTSSGAGAGTLTPGSTASAAAVAKRLMPVLEAVLKLVAAGLLVLNYTEYELNEFNEGLDHAQAAGRHTKVLLRMCGSGASGVGNKAA